MKLFIATDLHGSAFWTDKILQKFHASGADALVLLGDIYNHGPRNPFPQDYSPMRVAEMLNAVSSELIVIKGNCDSEVDEMISGFPFLREEILPWGNRRLFFTHGHIYNKKNLPKLSVGDVMFYGHFHISEIVETNGVICVNVGSCALPKDGKHAYCIADEKSVGVFDLETDEILCAKQL